MSILFVIFIPILKSLAQIEQNFILFNPKMKKKNLIFSPKLKMKPTKKKKKNKFKLQLVQNGPQWIAKTKLDQMD